jgi:trehalose 2-sulfotransferase
MLVIPAQGYLLCCIERTGSSFLAQTLASTGLAGRPREYFNPVEQDKQFMRNILGDTNLVDGLPKILSAGTTRNGVFGVKLHWAHLRFLGMSIDGRWHEWQRMAMYDMVKSRPIESLSVEAVNELLTPRFSDLRDHATAYRWLRSSLPDLAVVWLKRRNMVARAVSHFRAKRTGIWGMSVADREAAAADLPDLDLAEIHILNRIGSFQESLWQLFFSQQNLDPHVVIYEDLIADHDSAVRGVLDFLGLENRDTQIPSISSTRQSDEVSLEWEHRYRQWAVEFGV